MLIETARIRLRAVHAADLTAIVTGMSDWAVSQWLARTPWPYTRRDGEAFMELVSTNHAGAHPSIFAVSDLESDAFLGSVGVDVENDKGVVGYWLLPSAWGQGFASEAVAAIVGYSFDGLSLRRLRASTDPDNTRSQRVLIKAGFSPIGARPVDPPTRRGHSVRPMFELRR